MICHLDFKDSIKFCQNKKFIKIMEKYEKKKAPRKEKHLMVDTISIHFLL